MLLVYLLVAFDSGVGFGTGWTRQVPGVSTAWTRITTDGEN